MQALASSMARLRKERTARSVGHAKEPRPRPMRSGDPFGNHRQRPVALALVFESVLAYENGVGASAPLAHQGRAGLQHDAGIDRASPPLDNRMLRVRRPIEIVVLNCCVTETKDAPLASSTSTILAKSASERVSRSIL